VTYEVDDSLHRVTIDMAFNDANHQYSWPTPDAICLLPFISRSI